jgi:hypothetical protein
MSAPDILFKGIPRGNTRGYTADTLMVLKPERVVIPCVGSFALAKVALDAGVKPENIIAGDISIYSTTIGNAIMEKDWKLKLKPFAAETYDWLNGYLTDPISKAASVLFMIRILQYVRKNQNTYLRDLQRELVFSRQTYIDQLREQLIQIRDMLKGLHYHAQDMWVTMEQYRSEKNTALLVNPPRYDGGYDRMFAGVDEVFEWQEPDYKMFREKDYAPLMDLLGSSDAYTAMYYATQGEDPAPQWGGEWRSVFADKPGNKRIAAINWIIANRQVIPSKMTCAGWDMGESKYPLFNKEIKPDTTLLAMTVEKTVGDYYRDLFIHKLPGSVTEKYVALFLDGYLFAVVGLHMADLRMGSKKKGTMQRGSITFAFSVPQELYPRLHKLTLMSIVSSWFWDDVMGYEKGYDLFSRPKTIHTTMLTHHPENKTARGVLKMVDRVPQKDGSYKLSYSSPLIKRTRKETLDQWQKQFNSNPTSSK